MNRRSVWVILALAAASVAPAAQNNSARTQMEAARKAEIVDGDLRGAIRQYAAIADKFKADRAVAADALLRMAECYQKLGDSQARATYERLIREFGDQKDAVAIARTRLGGAPTALAASKGDRVVWTGSFVDGFGTITADGRLLTYTFWPTGGLVLRDLMTGTDRRLTAGTYAEGSTQFSAISHDGQHVAFQWWTNKRDAQLRVASLRGTGIPDPRTVYTNADITGIAPFDWSPDNTSLAVHVTRNDLTGQIGLLDVQSGRLTVLKTIGWGGPTKIFFSPDGKQIAYDLPDADDASRRNVFTMAVDGSRETTVVSHPSLNTIMGWSPDGKYLLFASDRTGVMGLWTLRMRDGAPHGAPEQVKTDIGSFWSLGLTSDGALHVWKDTGATYVQVNEIDLKAGTLGSSVFQQFIRSRGRPDWSADGKQLAYLQCAYLGGGPCTLNIRAMDTGSVRELRPKLQYLFFPRWSPDSRSLLTAGTDPKGHRGVYVIDSRTGDTSPLTFSNEPPRTALIQWAADGRHIYYSSNGTNGRAILERDLASGQETKVFSLPDQASGYLVSADGRYMASAISDGGNSSIVMTSRDGESRIAVRSSPPEAWAVPFSWTPNGAAVLVAKTFANSDHKELWLVPVTGDPRKLDIDIDAWSVHDVFRLSPDGRRIAFVGQAGKAHTEIWALENVFPRDAAPSQASKR
jgi:Tol biopolymer transport system component